MTEKYTWIGEAQPEEQGSFTDVASGHTYTNTNIVGAVKAESEAHDRGEEAVWLDSSIDPNVPYEIPEDQRFNILRTDTDSQGVSHPPKHGPGR